VRDERVAGNAEPASEIIPERHTVLGAGLGDAEESVAAIASGVAAGSGADLTAGDLTADVVLGPIGMQWDVRLLQHPQQLGLVGMQPRQQPIQRDEAGAAAEDAIEPRAQHLATAFAGAGSISLEIGVEVPNQLAHALLSGPMQIREGVQLVHQALGMHPACVRQSPGKENGMT